MKRTQQLKDSITAKGFYRLEIREDGKVVARSPWHKNLITNLGYQNYIVGSLGAIAGSSQIAYAALGTGGAPVATDTALSGEITDVAGMRIALTPSAVSSKTLQLTGSLNSNIITTTHAISNIGLFDRSTTSAGTIMAGNTYASSSLATNQTISLTYQIRFS